MIHYLIMQKRGLRTCVVCVVCMYWRLIWQRPSDSVPLLPTSHLPSRCLLWSPVFEFGVQFNRVNEIVRHLSFGVSLFNRVCIAQYVPRMVAVASSRGDAATFAAPGTQGRRQSHAKREGRRWGNMNGAHWEDGAAARRTCSTWPFGCELVVLSCGWASPPRRGPTPTLARRRRRRRRRRRVVSAPPCRRPPEGPRALAVEGVARGTCCGRWGPGCWAARGCAGGSGARARTPPPRSGGAAGGGALRGRHGMRPSARCARAPSSHRWRRAARGPSAPSAASGPAWSCWGTLSRRKRGKSGARSGRDRDGLRAPTWCGRSARRRPPEWRARPVAAAPRRAPMFTLVPDLTKNAYKIFYTSRGNVNVKFHTNASPIPYLHD